MSGKNSSLISPNTFQECGLIGEQGEIKSINFSEEVIHRDLVLAGSFLYEHHKVNELINMIRRGLNVEKIMTHTFSLNNSKKACELFDEGKTGKGLIKP